MQSTDSVSRIRSGPGETDDGTQLHNTGLAPPDSDPEGEFGLSELAWSAYVRKRQRFIAAAAQNHRKFQSHTTSPSINVVGCGYSWEPKMTTSSSFSRVMQLARSTVRRLASNEIGHKSFIPGLLAAPVSGAAIKPQIVTKNGS